MTIRSGKEFERLIDSHGPEHVTELMQKVISALEHLEQFAATSDSERDTIECLQRTVTHLELEEAKKVEERQRNDLELQQVEEHYKQETRDDGFACMGLVRLKEAWIRMEDNMYHLYSMF